MPSKIHSAHDSLYCVFLRVGDVVNDCLDEGDYPTSCMSPMRIYSTIYVLSFHVYQLRCIFQASIGTLYILMCVMSTMGPMYIRSYLVPCQGNLVNASFPPERDFHSGSQPVGVMRYIWLVHNDIIFQMNEKKYRKHKTTRAAIRIRTNGGET